MTTRPLFVDHALSARLEASEAAQIEALARAVAARLPAQRAAVAEIAGGRAVFIAPHVSVSRAAGLGMNGPVEARDIEALEDFYVSRDTEARILVSPFAHPSLFARLGERGFRLELLDTILVRMIGPAPETPLPDGVVVRRAARDEAADWVSVSLTAFAAPGEPPHDRAAIFQAAFDAPGATYFVASVDGAIAGTAALGVHERVGYLFAGSTLPAYRGRGAQRGLIEGRVAHARAEGCDLVFSGAEAGSGSQRNLERAGFVPVYSQALLIKSFP